MRIGIKLETDRHQDIQGCSGERGRRGRIIENCSASLVFNFRSDQGPVLQKVILNTCVHRRTHYRLNMATGKND